MLEFPVKLECVGEYIKPDGRRFARLIFDVELFDEIDGLGLNKTALEIAKFIGKEFDCTMREIEEVKVKSEG